MEAIAVVKIRNQAIFHLVIKTRLEKVMLRAIYLNRRFHCPSGVIFYILHYILYCIVHYILHCLHYILCDVIIIKQLYGMKK